MNYLCTYEYRYELKTTLVPAIQDVKEGFWINHRGIFTNLSDCQIWIPPNMIRFVVKDMAYPSD